MIGFFAAVATVASPASAAEDVHMRCAFQTADTLALASEAPAESVADQVIAACSAEAPETAPPITDEMRRSMRAAAVAMVARRRGLDGQPADAPFRIAAPIGSLDIPDEIAPAVIPYLRCQLASAGHPERSGNRVVPPPKGIARGSDCTAFRERARDHADRLLRAQGGQNKAARKAFIEKALQDVDDFHRASPRTPAAAPAAEGAE